MSVRSILWIALAVASAAETIHVDEPSRFIPVVGNWVIAQDANKNVLMVDGRQWKKGQPAGGLAEKARLIYGSRPAEVIDNVKSFAYYPYAVAQGVEDFRDGEIGMRFPVIDGHPDHCARIMLNLKTHS